MPSKHSAEEVTEGAPAADAAIPDAAAVRQQLDRLLGSSHLRNSKRCQMLLKYVVEAYLDGRLDTVRERCIGVEVFQREASYDTSQDSIVRTTAVEVRKRLAQYYLEPEHEQEVRFSLPQGSYCPEFRLPTAAPLPVTVAPEGAARRKWPSVRQMLAACSVLAVAGLAVLVYAGTRPTELDRFWAPLLEDPSGIVICIEQPLRIYRFAGPRAAEANQKMVGAGTTGPASTDTLASSPLHLSDLQPSGEHYFTYGDLMSASRLSELLGRRGKPFQVLGDRNTAYRDLRGRPAVFLGEFNNQWTLGLTCGLRFYLDKGERRYEVRDRQAANKVIASVLYGARTEEYSVVSRIVDVTTEKTIVTVVGTTYFGTMAGSEFLTREAYLREAFRNAPPDWHRKNIQILLKAPLVGGAPGPPRAIATHFW